MEGLKTARRSIKPWQMRKLVRRINEAGQQGVVLDLLRRVETTGVGLWDIHVAKEVMLGAVLKGVQGDWRHGVTEKACRLAELIWELVWDPRHSDEARKMSLDIRRLPEVLGALILVHAVRARQVGDKHAEMVGKYVQLLLKDWDGARLHMDTRKDGNRYHVNAGMVAWAPVWQGMKLAQGIVDKTTGQKVEEIVGDLEKTMKHFKTISMEYEPTKGPSRGQKLYDEMVKLST